MQVSFLVITLSVSLCNFISLAIRTTTGNTHSLLEVVVLLNPRHQGYHRMKSCCAEQPARETEVHNFKSWFHHHWCFPSTDFGANKLHSLLTLIQHIVCLILSFDLDPLWCNSKSTQHYTIWRLPRVKVSIKKLNLYDLLSYTWYAQFWWCLSKNDIHDI